MHARHINVIQVAHVIAPALVGGAEAVVRELALSSASAGLEAGVVALIQSAEPHPWVEGLRKAGARVDEVRCGRRRYRSEARVVADLLKSRGASIVHTHNYHSDVVGMWAARRLGLPAVTTVHGFTGGGFKNRLYEWLQRRALMRFDAVIATSRPLAHHLAHQGLPPYRLHIVPNAWRPAGESLGRAEARAALQVPAEGQRAAWIGRVSGEKGPDVFIDTMAMLLDQPIAASVIGDGPEKRKLERRAAALGLSERVKWHGTVPDAGRLLRAFDVVVLSSRTEGTPIVLFEAMAAEAPVVATAVGGVPDVVSSDEALLVPPQNAAALAVAIRSVMSDPRGAAQRARAARARLERDFAVEPWVARYKWVYERVLEAHAGRSPEGEAT